MTQPLAGIRVLDLADESADLAGRILSDLGADVVLIEPRRGSSSRRLAPFAGDEAGSESSYRHLFYNAGKRSAQLDPEQPEHAQQLRDWAARSDVLIETSAPGRMDALGLGYAELRALNPSLIYASVTPFGQDGEWSQWKSNDLVSSAAGGLLYICGEAEDPPTHGPAFPAYTMSGLVAAAGILVALRGRDATAGRPGVHLDLSQQIATLLSVAQTANANNWTQGRQVPTRPGLSQAMRCQDGRWASVYIFPNQLEGFIAWLDEAGIEHGITVDDWELFHSGKVVWKLLENPFQQLAKQLAAEYPRDEFLEKLWASGSAGLPSLDFAQMSEAEHYRTNAQFFEIDGGPGGRRLGFPRSPVDCLRSDPKLKRAPYLGEHTESVRKEFEAVAAPTESSTVEMPQNPLSGLRILDFCWMLAGPLGTRMLADFGADVIKIESGGARRDGLRGAPLLDGRSHLDLPELFNDGSTGKRSLTLDLTKERGREIVRELVAHADAITDNFSSGALARMGFPYQELRKINPGIVVVHMPGVGGEGPWLKQKTFGNLLMAASGQNHLMGFPGREPRGMGIAYPDFTSPLLLISCLLAALRERDRSGEGREVDFSQLSSSVSLIGAEWMRFGHTGVQPPPPGNRDPNYAPHGVYPTRGEDEWLALAVSDDAQWRVLSELIGGPELAADARFASHALRKRNEDALDALVREWTREQDRWDLAAQLQSQGIAAAPVEKLPDLVDRDPQLQRHYQRIRQPADPSLEITIDGNPIRFAGRKHILKRAPSLGEHNEEILNELLDVTPEAFAQLVLDGVIL